jgi:uncharacterized coiled-coil protein SlyX
VDEKRLERIEVKIDDIDDQLAMISSTLAAQHVSLKEHMRRSNALEAKLAPVEKHVAMVNGALKLLGVFALIASIIEAIYRIK